MTIYFAQMGDWLKIGYTAGEPTRRIAQLQTGQPQKITLIGTIPGERDAELGLHEHFSDFRGNGEWFDRRAVEETIRFLIENQHPWYHCREIVSHDAISEKWKLWFKPHVTVDISAYEDAQVTFRARDVHGLIAKDIEKSRRKRGYNRSFERGIYQTLMSRAAPYITYKNEQIIIWHEWGEQPHHYRAA